MGNFYIPFQFILITLSFLFLLIILYAPKPNFLNKPKPYEKRLYVFVEEYRPYLALLERKKEKIKKRKNNPLAKCQLLGIIYPDYVYIYCKQNSVLLKKGEKFNDCVLKDILENKTIFVCEGEKIVLNLYKNENKRENRKSGQNFSSTYKSHIKTVERQKVIDLISSGKIFYQMAVVPFYKNGKVIGFRVTGVRPNSFVYKMGIRRGDIILSVNGYPIRSMEEGFSAFERLKDSSEINIKVLRHGKEITLSYLIED